MSAYDLLSVEWDVKQARNWDMPRGGIKSTGRTAAGDFDCVLPLGGWRVAVVSVCGNNSQRRLKGLRAGHAVCLSVCLA